MAGRSTEDENLTETILPGFADRFWRRSQQADSSGPVLPPEHVDQPEYREVADNQPTLCWVANADGYITWYNRRWHDYCGTTPKEMEGWGWQSVHDPDVLPAVMAGWTASIATGEPFEMTFPLRGADGIFRPFLTRIVPLRDDAGVVRRWIGNNFDVSAQIAAEEELRRSQENLERAHRALAEREAFLSSVLASSTDCIKVLDLDGRLTFMSEGGQRVMEVSDFNAIAGCPWPDFWTCDGNTAAKDALAAARHGTSTNFVGQANTMAGTPKWWHVAVSPIKGQDGQPDQILAVSRDITGLRQSEEERDRFVRLAENSTDFVGMAHRDGRVFFLNDAARRMVGLEGVDVSHLSVVDFFPSSQAKRVQAEILPAVDRSGHWEGEIEFRHFVSGATIPVLYSVFPITDPSGGMTGYGTVTRDFRARKAAEEELRLLNGELAHRLKNVLSVVQSVAAQTLRGAVDTQAAALDLSARLAALGAATDVLTGTGWRSADLLQLATRTLAAHGRLGDRIRIDGPPITLRPQGAVALALALHELATNAAKYGALSNDDGTVTLIWHVENHGEEPRFQLTWREDGGPPVSQPTRRGFGTTLIERSLRSYFRGVVATDFPPEGFRFSLETRLADAALVGVE